MKKSARICIVATSLVSSVLLLQAIEIKQLKNRVEQLSSELGHVKEETNNYAADITVHGNNNIVAGRDICICDDHGMIEKLLRTVS